MVDSYSVYTHKVVTDEGKEMFYVGISKQLKIRWRPSAYKRSTLYPYIQQYGWDNIEHSIVKKDLCKDDAYKLEDELIKQFQLKNCCINRLKSGLRTKDMKTYNHLYNAEYKAKHREELLEKKRNWYHSNRELIIEQRKQYRTEHSVEIKERRRRHYQEHKEEIKAKAREYRKNKKLNLL